MKRISLILLFLSFALLAQSKTFLPFQVTSSNGRPLNDYTVKLKQSESTVATLTYLDNSAGWYYWTGGTSTVPWGDYDIYITISGTDKLWRSGVSIRNGYTISQVARDTVSAVMVDSLPDLLPRTTQYKDTTQLKAATSDSFGFVVNLKQLSSTNTRGGGLFVLRPASEYVVDGVVCFESGGSGEWVRQEWINSRRLNVRWAGALGDNATDDSAAIARARSSAVANRGGWLYFPEGQYKTSAPVNATSPNEGINDRSFILEGDGIGKTTITFTDTSQHGIDVNYGGGTGYSYNVQIRNMSIKGSGAEGARGSGAGINFEYTELGKIENVLITGFKYGVYTQYCNSFVVANSRIFGNQFGVWGQTAANEYTLRNNYIVSNDSIGWYQGAGIVPIWDGGAMGSQPYHLYLGNGGNVSVMGGNWESYDSAAVYMFGAGEFRVYSLTVNGGATSNWINCTGGSDIRIYDISFSNISSPTVYSRSTAPDIQSFGSDAVRIYDATNNTYLFANPFQPVADNGSFTADSSGRGIFKWKYRRKGSPASDNYPVEAQLNDTTYHTYYLLDGSDMRVSSNASTGSIARVDRLIHAGFRWPFNTAGASQDCTQVVVDLSSKLPGTSIYSVTATPEQSQGRNISISQKSQSSDVYTFVIWQQPPDTSIASFSGFMNIHVVLRGDFDAY